MALYLNTDPIEKGQMLYLPFSLYGVEKASICKSLISICADGDEAEYIATKFFHAGYKQMTIPWNYKSHASQQWWFGDIAKTILMAL